MSVMIDNWQPRVELVLSVLSQQLSSNYNYPAEDIIIVLSTVSSEVSAMKNTWLLQLFGSR